MEPIRWLAAVEQAFAKLIPGRIAGVCAKPRRSFTARSLPPILLSGMPHYPSG